MAGYRVPPNRGAEQIKRLLDSPEIGDLIESLEATRWTGRPGYPIRTMVGMALAKSLYVLPTWTRTVRLVAEHAALRSAIGGAPSVDACYRFTRKLRKNRMLFDACIASVLVSLRDQLPEFGTNIAIDGSDLPAYANGQRYLYNHGPERKRFSDPDASWGHRSAVSTRKGGGFYGYRLHAAVCTVTGLPVAWETHTAKDAEVPVVPGLLDTAAGYGFRSAVCVADKGYDVPRSTTGVRLGASAPSFPFASLAVSSPGSTRPRRVTMERGRSPVPTPSGGRPSTAARLVSAHRQAAGSLPTGCTRWFPVRPPGGKTCTAPVVPSSGSSGG